MLLSMSPVSLGTHTGRNSWISLNEFAENYTFTGVNEKYNHRPKEKKPQEIF